MHKILVLSLLLTAFSQAGATTVAVDPVSVETISAATLDHAYNYQMTVNWDFKPLRVTGNIFKPSTFVIKCGANVVGSESRKINPADFNKNISVVSQFKFDSTTCPDLVFVAETSISGASTEYVKISYEPVSLGERLEVYIDRITTERATNKVAITKYASKLSTYAGSKEALYCVIAGNLNDDLTGGVAEAVKVQYENIYGPYVPNIFTCPVAAEGKLDSSIDYCAANPGEIEPFCLVYEKYKTLSAWYSTTIAEIESKKAGITDEGSQIYKKITTLEESMNKDKNLFKVIVK